MRHICAVSKARGVVLRLQGKHGILGRIGNPRRLYLVANTIPGKPELLFKHKEGPVNVTVHGPRTGFLWTTVNYFRWVQSTKEPGQWEKRNPDREQDQVHLEKCVKAVRKWFQERPIS